MSPLHISRPGPVVGQGHAWIVTPACQRVLRLGWSGITYRFI